MLKKSITYTDYEGITRTEDFYFNLSKAEVLEMNYSKTGGYERWIRQIVDAEDTDTMMKTIKDVIMRSYGRISLDGKRFIKSKEMSEEFTQTEAYSELLVELMQGNGENISEFMNGIASWAKDANAQNRSDDGKVTVATIGAPNA